MKESLWEDNEVKNLFSLVEKLKEQNKKMTDIFKEYSLISGRKPNSIRNYYYMELGLLNQNQNRCKNLNIDLTKHITKKGEKFSDIESKKLVDEITRLNSLGYSVRSACLKLSNGDLEKMVRLQNKYRTIKSKNAKTILDSKKDLKNKGFVLDDNKIITMPIKNKTLSDNDITSLFLGLIKLVKKNATSLVSQNLIKDAEFANDSLRKALVNLNKKENEIALIRSKFKILQKENISLKDEILSLKTEKLKKSTKQLNKLANFVDDLKINKSSLAES